MIRFKKPPLPFVGSKKNQIKNLENILSPISGLFEKNDLVFIDFFGGSGLLSRCIKDLCKNSFVIWNDYDDYKSRIDKIPQTNKIIASIRELGLSTQKNSKFTDSERDRIFEVLREYKDFDSVTMSNCLLFNGNFEDCEGIFNRKFLWNNLPSTPYDSEGYLEGLHRISKDFREISFSKDDILVLDPPYLNTFLSHYHTYWRLKDFLDLMDLVVFHIKNGGKFLFFSSSKSQIIELFEWFKNREGIEYNILDSKLQSGDIDYLITNF